MNKLTYTREAEFGDVDGERVPMVLSTEHPVERGDFVEVLAHDAESAVDLARAPLPLLTMHDHHRLPVGVVEDVRLDVGARVLRGFARFANTPEAQALLAQVRDKTLRWISVGYELVALLRQDGRTARWRWRPLEASLVAVAADPNAQFYRNHTPRIIMSDNTAGNAGSNTEADRLKGIMALGDSYKRYLRDGDVREACERNTSVTAFQELILQRMESAHSDTSAPFVDLNRREIERYSLARAIAASITGDWSKAGLEREASRAIERTVGMSAVGFFVPTQALGRDFNVGTSTEAGNLVATDLRTDLYVDVLRNSIVAGPMGMKILTGLSGNVDIPRKATASTLGMLTEIGSASETNPATAKVSLTPKRVGAYIEYSKQALIQSGLALEGMLRDDLVTGAAVLLEYQALNGAGTGAEMRGIRNTTGIGTSTAGANGATVAWSHFVDLETQCANANAIGAAMAGYVTNAKVRSRAKQVQKGTNLDFVWPDTPAGADGFAHVCGYRAGVSNNIPSNLTKGTSTTVCSAALFSSDWSMAVLALFGAPDVTVDPYTLAATGQVRITLNQFADFGVRQPAAFAKIEDLLTT